MQPTLSALGTGVPAYHISQTAALRFLDQQLELSDVERRKLRFLYRSTRIAQRHSVLRDFSETGTAFFNPDAPPTTGQRMQAYEKHALPLALKVLQNTLTKDDLESVTHLITVSCTGMYAPGLDIELIAATSLRSDVARTSINFMGCYAAFNALKTAAALCRAYSEARVLIVDVELCTLHFQPSLQEDHVVSNALFADGAAVALVENQPVATNAPQLELLDFYSDLAPEGNADMGWYVRDYGFEMILKSSIPEHLRGGIGALTQRLLTHWQLDTSAIRHWAVHPGGRKILEAIGEALSLPDEALKPAYEVLHNYGNMSSATVFFVLQRILQQLTPKQRGEYMVGMAFGPGLTIESGLWRVV